MDGIISVKQTKIQKVNLTALDIQKTLNSTTDIDKIERLIYSKIYDPFEDRKDKVWTNSQE